MSTVLLECEVMAEAKRRYGPAKIDVEALTLARKAAAMNDKTLADYLSDLILEHVDRYIPVEPSKSSLRPQSSKK